MQVDERSHVFYAEPSTCKWMKKPCILCGTNYKQVDEEAMYSMRNNLYMQVNEEAMYSMWNNLHASG